MFVHHVFFWLKEENSKEEVQLFEKGIRSLLNISSILKGDIGKPADTNRPVIERSYSYSLLLQFTDKELHDAYQVDPVHLRFVEECSTLWKKVLIYDSVSIL